MLRKPLLSLILVILFGGVFFYGLTRLFVLRYEMGDVYPPYLSLRADPIGTKALATALDELPNVDVQRNFKPLPKLKTDAPITLVYAGVTHNASWTEQELLAFDSLVTRGSRAVFTFLPVANAQSTNEDKHARELAREAKKRKKEAAKGNQKKKEEAKEKKDGEPDKTAPDEKKEKKPAADEKKSKDKRAGDEEEEPDEKYIDFDTVAKRWGFGFGYLPEEKGKSYDRHATQVEADGKLEPDISWHSALYFRDLKPQWKVLYMCGNMPVIIERKFGEGSIVLAADSFLVSNEALRGERHPRLISRLFSGSRTIIFDEEHNNLRDDPGIASLARKYRLHGLMAGLVLLAIFFVWKNAVRFIPAYETSTAASDVVAGKESGEGFINLLRRSIRPSSVFEVCIAEWRKAFAHQPKELAKVEQIRAQYESHPARSRDPIATYRAISQALARKI